MAQTARTLTIDGFSEENGGGYPPFFISSFRCLPVLLLTRNVLYYLYMFHTVRNSDRAV